MKAERRSSSTRKAHEAELDDIIGIFNFLDSQSVLVGMTFHSMALDHLPGVYGPENINIAVIADHQIRMNAKVQHLTSSMADFLTDNNVFTSQLIGDVTKSCQQVELQIHRIV